MTRPLPRGRGARVLLLSKPLVSEVCHGLSTTLQSWFFLRYRAERSSLCRSCRGRGARVDGAGVQQVFETSGLRFGFPSRFSPCRARYPPFAPRPRGFARSFVYVVDGGLAEGVMSARPSHLRLVAASDVSCSTRASSPRASGSWAAHAPAAATMAQLDERGQVLLAAAKSVLTSHASYRLDDQRRGLCDDLTALRRDHDVSFPGASLVTDSSDGVRGALHLVRAQLRAPAHGDDAEVPSARRIRSIVRPSERASVVGHSSRTLATSPFYRALRSALAWFGRALAAGRGLR